MYYVYTLSYPEEMGGAVFMLAREAVIVSFSMRDLYVSMIRRGAAITIRML